jgi:hypothetical protein
MLRMFAVLMFALCGQAHAWTFSKSASGSGVLEWSPSPGGNVVSLCWRDGPSSIAVQVARPGSDAAQYKGERPARFRIDDEAVPNETVVVAVSDGGKLTFKREVQAMGSFSFPLALGTLLRDGMRKVDVELVGVTRFVVSLAGARKSIDAWLSFCGAR